jgi:hypothetical protein
MANSVRTPPVVFLFLPANALIVKPDRNKGITKIRGPYYNIVLSLVPPYMSSCPIGANMSMASNLLAAHFLLCLKRGYDLIEVVHNHGALSFHLIYLMASIPDSAFLPRLLC